MFNYLKNILNVPQSFQQKYSEDKNLKVDETKKLQIATCTLFIELAKADDSFTNQERDKIISIMSSTFDLEKECINDFIELAERRLKSDDDIYNFTELINNNFNNNQKFELLKNLWRLIYIDKDLNIYEDHLVKYIGGLINMGHEDIIGTKLLVKEEMRNNE